MATPYQVIFESFESKIEDHDLARMTIEDRLADEISYMNEAITYLIMGGLVLDADLSKKEDKQLEFEDDLSVPEIEILAMYMVGAWHSRRVNSLAHTSLFVGSSGEKWDQQKSHWETSRDMRDYWFNEARFLYTNWHTHNNAYLEDE